MDRSQVKDSASEQKGKAERVADGESAEHKRKSEKHGGKDGSVLADINDSPKKERK